MGKIKKSVSTNLKKSKNLLERATWKKVKLVGNILSDDGGGLEGLIGLEVLESYEDKTVKKSRAITSRQRKNSDEDFDAVIEHKKLSTKKLKKKIVINKNIPGQFVLLKSRKTGNKNKKMNVCLKTNEHSPINVEEISQQLHINEMSAWNGLGIVDEILRALADKGFKEPTEIQRLTIPSAIMGRKDILGAAETGSGKTLAFGIPILNGILEFKKGVVGKFRKYKPVVLMPTTDAANNMNKLNNQDRDNLTPPPDEINNFPIESETESSYIEQDDNLNKPLYALILTPTRELAVQIKDHLIVAAKYTDIKIAAIFGGLAVVKQERILQKCPEIVVATPGRLWELLKEGNKHLNKLDNINFLVIDETDRMVEKGHFDELKLLLNRLNADVEKKTQRQNFVFSATLTFVHELPNYIKNRKHKMQKQTSQQKLQSLIQHLGIQQPKIVDITKIQNINGIDVGSITAQGLTECRITCEHHQKDLYLYYFLLRHPGRTIVFCNSIDCVRRLGQLFNILNCQARPLHAHMNQKQRLKNLEKFTKISTALLIATDVAARGLDIPNVQHVIHYQIPRSSENYIHRSGRTARGNKEGITVLLVEPTEAKAYAKLCKTLGKSDDIPLFPVSQKYLKSVKDRVQLATDIDLLELKMKRTHNDIGWLKKTAKEMDIIVNDMDSDFSEKDIYDSDDQNSNEKFKDKRLLQTKRMQLSKLLDKPIFPTGFSYKYPTSTGTLQMPSYANQKNAIDIMKNVINENKVAKKKRKIK